MRHAVDASPDHPILIDKFLESAIELDVDALCDGTDVIVAGVMQHIEEAGIHSGDSACILPPYDLDPQIQERVKEQTRAMALELNVIGLMNVQFAIREDKVYILEVNPRASRTVPFVMQAISLPPANISAPALRGKTLQALGVMQAPGPKELSAM